MKWEHDMWTRDDLRNSFDSVPKGLTALGAECWELVAVIPATPESHETYYFKRPVNDSPPSGMESK